MSDIAIVVQQEVTQAVVIDRPVPAAVTIGLQGPPGPIGPTGPQGPQGPTGASYVHDQASASALWMIHHNMSCFPSVTVVDSSGATVVGSVTYVDSNTVQIQFSSPFTGEAYLN